MQSAKAITTGYTAYNDKYFRKASDLNTYNYLINHLLNSKIDIC